MTLHRMWMALTVGAATVALLAMSPAPALADEGRFRDARFDTAHPADITSVRVEHGKRIVVVIHHRNLTFRSMADAPHMVRVAFDVGPRYDGPEFYVRVPYQADQPADLRPAQGWGTMHNPPLPSCSGEHVSVSAPGTNAPIPKPFVFTNAAQCSVNLRDSFGQPGLDWLGASSVHGLTPS